MGPKECLPTGAPGNAAPGGGVVVVKEVVKEVEEEEELVDLHKNHQSHCCCSVLDNLKYIAWICYLKLPPIFAVY